MTPRTYEALGTMFSNYDDALRALIAGWLEPGGEIDETPEVLAEEIISSGWLSAFEACYGEIERGRLPALIETLARGL
jgi:hypothetical protein